MEFFCSRFLGFIRWIYCCHNLKYCIAMGAIIPAVSGTRCAVLGRFPRRMLCPSLLKFGCRIFFCCCLISFIFCHEAVGGLS